MYGRPPSCRAQEGLLLVIMWSTFCPCSLAMSGFCSGWSSSWAYRPAHTTSCLVYQAPEFFLYWTGGLIYIIRPLQVMNHLAQGHVICACRMRLWDVTSSTAAKLSESTVRTRAGVLLTCLPCMLRRSCPPGQRALPANESGYALSPLCNIVPRLV